MKPENFRVPGAIQFMRNSILDIFFVDVNTYTTMVVGNPVLTSNRIAMYVNYAIRNRIFKPGFGNKCQENVVTVNKLFVYINNYWMRFCDIQNNQGRR